MEKRGHLQSFGNQNSTEQSTEKLQIAIPFAQSICTIFLFIFFFIFSLHLSHRSDFLSSKIHLWDSVSKLRAYNKNSLGEYCNVRFHALLPDQLRHVLLYYMWNNYHTFMFRLKLLLCLFKKKKRLNLKKWRCNLKIRYSCFLCLLLELPEMSLLCFICFLAWELNPFCY